MHWGCIQGVVIDGVRTHTWSCYRWSEDSHKELLLMEYGLIQGVVIDAVGMHTGSCYRWSEDSYRELL